MVQFEAVWIELYDPLLALLDRWYLAENFESKDPILIEGFKLSKLPCVANIVVVCVVVLVGLILSNK